jgi:gas vesicle protein
MFSKDHTARWIAGIGVGFAAGCVLGVLYAPQAGRRTRRQIAGAVKDSVDEVTAKAQDLTESIQRKTKRFRSDAQDLIEQGQTAIAKSKAQVESVLEKGADLYRMAAR